MTAAATRSAGAGVCPAVVGEFDEQGVAIIPGMVDRQVALSWRPILERLIDEDIDRWGDNPFYADHYMVHNLMARHEVFLSFLDNDTMHAYLDACFCLNPIVYGYTSSSMPPSGSNYSHRIHVDCPRLIPGYRTNIGVILALDDFTEENGATYFLPGSFERAEPPGEDEFFAHARRLLPRAGDALLVNPRTWHYGGWNATAAPRHAITVNICRPYIRQRFDYPRLLGTELLDRVSPRLRRFLGYDVRIPASLEEYYVAPDQRLHKGGLE